MEKPVPLDQFLDQTDKAKVDAYLPAGEAAVEASGRSVGNARDYAAHQILQMKEFVLDLYKGTSASRAFLDTAGGVVDCMPREKQPTALAAAKHGLKLRAKPAGSKPPAGKVPLAPGRKDAFGTPQECPEGTIPWKRITLDGLAKLGHLNDFFGPLGIGSGDEKGGPGGRGHGDGTYYHRYATAESHGGPFYGCQGWFNVWAPKPHPGVFSLGQLWLVRPWGSFGAKVQTVESGWQVYPQHPHANGSSLPYLFVFFNPDGYGGNSGYLVNKHGAGFIYHDDPGWTIGSPLDPDLVTQSEDEPRGLMMRWASYENGDWELWVGLSEDEMQAVGYLPGGLYGPGYDGRPFSRLEFGGEVTSQPQQNATGPMGSGRRPTGSTTGDFGKCAFIKYLAAQYESGGSYEPVGDFQVKSTGDAPTYTCTLNQGHGFGTHIFFGGG